MIFRADRVAGAQILEADRRADVTGLHELDGVLVVGVHLVETGHALLLTRTGIEHVGTGIQVTGIDTDIRQASHERVGRNLEHKTAERLGGLGLQLHLLLVREVRRLRRADIQRGREVTHHGIQQELDAFVLERGTAACRNNLHGDGALAQRGDDLLLRDGFGRLEVLVHQGVVAFGGGFDQLVVPEGDSVLHVGGNVLDLVVHQVVARLVDDRLPGNQVNNSLEILLRTNGEADRNGGGTELGLDLLDTGEEISTDAVHLVHIGNLRHAIFICLAPNRLGLGLNAPHGAERGYRTVEDTEGTLDLHREVHMARSVDQVDLIRLPAIVPERGGGSGSDGDTTLLLLHHPVHRGCTFVDLTDLVGLAGVVEDALGRGGLAGIDVRHDADVPRVLKISFSHLTN